MTYPIPGLNRRQRAVFEHIAVGEDQFHHPKTLAVLMEIGAILETVVELRDRLGVLRIKRYEVPLGLHARWCGWCAEQPDPPAPPAEGGA
jgi:hypothetical protein